jgi:hypothetical protein
VQNIPFGYLIIFNISTNVTWLKAFEGSGTSPVGCQSSTSLMGQGIVHCTCGFAHHMNIYGCSASCMSIGVRYPFGGILFDRFCLMFIAWGRMCLSPLPVLRRLEHGSEPAVDFVGNNSAASLVFILIAKGGVARYFCTSGKPLTIIKKCTCKPCHQLSFT